MLHLMLVKFAVRTYTNNKLQVQRNEMEELNTAQTHKMNLLEARILTLEGVTYQFA